VKVLDFGLAKLTETAGRKPRLQRPAPGRERSSALPPTCPRAGRGQAHRYALGHFSFGSVLYEMVTGQRAFRGDTRASTIGQSFGRPKANQAGGGGAAGRGGKDCQALPEKGSRAPVPDNGRLRVALEELKEESDSGSLSDEVSLPPSGRDSSPGLLRCWEPSHWVPSLLAPPAD